MIIGGGVKGMGTGEGGRGLGEKHIKIINSQFSSDCCNWLVILATLGTANERQSENDKREHQN